MIYDKLTLADINAVVESTKEKPIVGTWALATCMGILFYDRSTKKAYAAHASSDYMELLEAIVKALNPEKDTCYEYMIIPGSFWVDNNMLSRKTEMENYLNKFFNDKVSFIPMTESFENVVNADDKTGAYEFAFDAETASFVTKKIKFDYNLVGKAVRSI